MKRWFALLLSLVCALGLAACSGQPHTANSPEPEEASGAKDWGVTLSARHITPTGMTLVISQSGGEVSGQLQYGDSFALETLSAGAWEAVPYIVPEDSVSWYAIAYLLAPGQESEKEINWEYIYGSLPAGTYRLSTDITDFRGTGDYDTQTYTVEFEIT